MPDDIFVSYAHADNRPPLAVGTAASGWVSTLVSELRKVLRRKLGGEGLSIAMGDELSEGGRFNDRALRRVENCRTFLAVLSPRYFESEWCRRELTACLRAAGTGRFRTQVLAVEIERGTRREWPSELESLAPLVFWDAKTSVSGLLGSPLPDSPDSLYWHRVNELAHAIAEHLRQAPEAITAAAPQVASRASRTVVVAETTPDLEYERSLIVSSLAQHGELVLPARSYPRDSEHAFHAAVERDLVEASLFVQLLGLQGGDRLPPTGKGIVELQSEAARQRGLRVMQWRAPDIIDRADVTDRGLLELLTGPNTISSSLEDFRYEVLRVAEASQAPSPGNSPARRAPSPRPLSRDRVGAAGLSLYVQAAPEDADQAEQIADALSEAGATVLLSPEPSPGKTFLEVRTRQEEAMRQCDGMLLVYGAAPPSAIQVAFLLAQRVFGVRRRGIWCAVLDLLPSEGRALPIRSPNLEVVSCRNGFQPVQLMDFFQGLQSEVAART